MMGRATLKEIREKLAAARADDAGAQLADQPPVAELEALMRLLEAPSGANPSASPPAAETGPLSSSEPVAGSERLD